MFHLFQHLAESRFLRKQAEIVYEDPSIVNKLMHNFRKLIRQQKLAKTCYGKQSIYMMNSKVYGYSTDTLIYLFKDVFLQGTYHFKTAKQNPIVIDCGSSIGTSVFFFKWLYPNAIIHAFEPSPSAFIQLEENISKNKFKDVECHNLALAGTNGVCDFFEPSGETCSLIGSFKEARNSGCPVTVNTTKLSDFIFSRHIETIDYLKMDIEGAETEVFANLAESGMLNRIQQMGIEYHHNIQGSTMQLGTFLRILEDANFDYSLMANGNPVNILQMHDVHIFAKKRE